MEKNTIRNVVNPCFIVVNVGFFIFLANILTVDLCVLYTNALL